MIEFSGYITGITEKFFYKRTIRFAQKMMLFPIACMGPLFTIYSIKTHKISLFIGCCVVAITMILLPYIATKVDKQKIIPKKIYIKDNTIVYISDKFTESKIVDDIREVRDYGEFYVLLFSFGNYSDKFICQKSLISKGSLEEFESLFEGKIVRKNQGMVL